MNSSSLLLSLHAVKLYFTDGHGLAAAVLVCFVFIATDAQGFCTIFTIIYYYKEKVE